MTRQCKHPCCGEVCRKPPKPKKAYTLKRTPLKKKPYKINKVSDKRKVQISEYTKKRKLFLANNKLCSVGVLGCTKVATEIHHMAGRENDLLTDEQHWLPICRNCHTYITEHSSWAIENGYSKNRIK